MSIIRNVHYTKYPYTKCPYTKCPLTKCPITIFDMWESFGYGSTKFLAQIKMSTHHGIMTSLSPFYN